MRSKSETQKKTDLQKVEPTYSQRFTNMVVKEFGNQVGTLQLSPHQQRLAQHLFIGLDTSLKKMESDRLAKNQDKKLPVVWSNINMDKLSIDAVHRIELGLDALIPNHIHPVPYQNSKTGKYDLDLRVGYIGKDYYHRKMAIDQPVDIIYELVCQNDNFKPLKKTAANPIESYEFDIEKPFDRGPVVGGFGYIMYENPDKNKLILVSKADFDKSKNAAQSDKFWSNYPTEMMFKTLVHRVTSKLNIDPEKVNASFMAVEMDDNQAKINQEANKGPIIDIEPEPGPEPEKETSDADTGGENKDNGKAYLHCPSNIDKKQPRKSTKVCKQCDSRDQCDPFVEWMTEQEGDQEQRTGTGPEF